MTADENYRLLQEMDANRRFLLAAYWDNPALLAQAEPRIRAWLSGMGGHEPPLDPALTPKKAE